MKDAKSMVQGLKEEGKLKKEFEELYSDWDEDEMSEDDESSDQGQRSDDAQRSDEVDSLHDDININTLKVDFSNLNCRYYPRVMSENSKKVGGCIPDLATCQNSSVVPGQVNL